VEKLEMICTKKSKLVMKELGVVGVGDLN